MKEDNDSKGEMDIMMRMEGEKQKIEGNEGKNDESTDITKALINSESHIIIFY